MLSTVHLRLTRSGLTGARLPRLAYGALVALLIAVYASVVAKGRGMGVDYACFRAASLLLARGGNPFDYGQLFQMENRLYNLPLHLHPGALDYYYLDEFRNPILFATLLTPLARLPLQPGFLLYTLGVVTLAVAGVWLTLCAFDWTHRRGEAIAITLVSPCVFLCVWNGQQSTLLLCALGGALYALRRERPGLAGALLAVGWVKPHLLVPVALVAPLLLPSRRATVRCYVGFGAMTALGTALTAATSGPGSIAVWLHSLIGYTGYSHVAGVVNVDTLQNYLPSFSGMGLVLLPHPWNRIVAVAVMLVGVAVMALVIARTRHLGTAPGAGLSTMAAIWLLVAPYVHTNDDVLLLPALVLACGHNGQRATRTLPLLSLWSLSTFTLAFLLPPPWSLLGTLPPLLVAAAALTAPLEQRTYPFSADTGGNDNTGAYPATGVTLRSRRSIRSA